MGLVPWAVNGAHCVIFFWNNQVLSALNVKLPRANKDDSYDTPQPIYGLPIYCRLLISFKLLLVVYSRILFFLMTVLENGIETTAY